MRGTVLDSFASHLSERIQSVIVNSVVCASRPLAYDVPQGSVHDSDYQKYPDDTELCKGASPDQFDCLQSCIQTSSGDVLIWLNSNKRK